MHTLHNGNSAASFRFQRNVAIIGILLFLLKLAAWYLTDSDAVFSDTMESIVNIIAAFMGLYSLYLAAKPKDYEHPYGHGKVEFVTSGVEGALIIFAGILIIIEAVQSLLHGNVPKDLDYGMLMITATAIINYLLGYFSIQKGIAENSLVLQSSGKHLQSDTLTTAGVVVSMILVYFTGLYWIDAAVAAFFGGYIIIVGYRIIRSALSGIMDEADPGMLKEVADFLEKNRRPTWIDVHNMRIQQHGSGLHIDAHLTLPYFLQLKDAHREMEELIVMIAKENSRSIEFNFHMDDCRPFSCEICMVKNCPVRQHEFKQKITWDALTISQPKKHNQEGVNC